MPADETATRLMIHHGTHCHDGRSGASKGLVDSTKHMVQNILAVDPYAGPRKVQMCLAKEIVSNTLLRRSNKDGSLGERQRFAIAEELGPLVQQNWLVHVTLIVFLCGVCFLCTFNPYHTYYDRFRRSVTASRGRGACKDSFGIDALLKLKRDCTYDFFHGSRFPGQGLEGEKCFVFKMSTVGGPASGVDLVNRMRRDGDGDL